MCNIQIEEEGVRLVLQSLDDKGTVILRKIDNLRKMKGSIDDVLYDSINTRYQEDLKLLEQTVMVITSQF